MTPPAPLNAPTALTALTGSGSPSARGSPQVLPWHLVAGRVLLPSTCAGCGRWDTPLCPDCLALLAGSAHHVEHLDALEGIEVLALSTYAGPARHLVLAWKNGSREDLNRVISAAGRRAGTQWASNLEPAGLSLVTRTGRLLVVPAPSGPVRRLRGRLVAADLADAVARGCALGLAEAGADAAEGVRVLSADLLRRPLCLTGTHQAGRSSRARRTNRAQEPRVLAQVSGQAVLLVDDVVTTGATLGACARALSRHGATVLGALTLAAAPSPARASPSGVPGRGGLRSAPGDQGGSLPRRTSEVV